MFTNPAQSSRTMSTAARDTAALSAKIELMEQRNAKQLTVVTDELVLVKQQLAQLIQCISIGSSSVCERLPAVQHCYDSSVPSQQQQKQQQFEHRHQRARISDAHTPVLARDEVLGTVFSFVGIGEYYYVAGVCRNWRGRYMTLCKHTLARWPRIVRPPHTSYDSIVMTADRLQLALDNGVTIDQLMKCRHLPYGIVKLSLEPIAVLTLARLYGLQWDDRLTTYAAETRQYVLLKWLLNHGCPVDFCGIINDVYDTANNDLEHKKQLPAITGPWPVGGGRKFERT
jgi:hypothetical protein